MTNLGMEAPEIFPPSPTVASLMRFEEIPVNGYTGIPDINIPIYSLPTLSEKVQIDVSLNYHATGIGADEIAGHTGLGWSLMAGGSISRTVRGIPDEIWGNSTMRGAKIGIYHRDGSNNAFDNYYYGVEASKFGGGLTTDWDRVDEFKWNGYEKGMYDTEHDLYQYNFMGISGRFYLRMHPTNNNLEVVRLDDNTQYRISVDATGPQFNNKKVFDLKGFTVVDDKGIQYIFKEREMVLEDNHSSISIYFDNSDALDGYIDLVNHYPTAFHLTQILDENDQELAHFTYSTNIEKTQSKQVTENTDEQNIVTMAREQNAMEDPVSTENVQRAEPKLIVQSTTRKTETKKLSKITVPHFGSIEFSVSGNREDTNLPADNGAVQLDQILVKNGKGARIKKFTLSYDQFTVKNYRPENLSPQPTAFLKRLILREVNEYGKKDTPDPLKYVLEYQNENNNVPNIYKNPWGYLEYESLTDHSGKTFNTTGVLSKMKVPTGGYIKFDFEPGTYSHKGDEAITDFSANPDNHGVDPNSTRWKNYLYGGGIKIGSVSFFDRQEDALPSLIKEYGYGEFDDKLGVTSSGSLAFSEPVFEFWFGKKAMFINGGRENIRTLYYTSKTSFNNLSFIRSQGTDVGYQKVTITDVDPQSPLRRLGRTENIYRAPQEFPEYLDELSPEDDIVYAINYPFVPLRNYDYSRGQLKSSSVYGDGKLLKETVNQYDLAHTKLENTGLKLSILNGGGCPYAFNYKNYLSYKIKYNQCKNLGGANCSRVCYSAADSPTQHIQAHPIQEASGWARRVQTTTREYFYIGNTQKVLETEEYYTYHDLNKQVKEQKTENSLGETLKTTYQYPLDLTNSTAQGQLMQKLVLQNRISEPIITRDYNQSTVLLEKRTEYGEQDGPLRPKKVYAKRGQMGLQVAQEDLKLSFRRYAPNGKLLEYVLGDDPETGIPVSIIWGYNDQYPIAKVEGVTYAELENGGMVAPLVVQSNNGTLQASHFAALSAMDGAMVTGYIYDPLVGPTLIIQPNGQYEQFGYDAYGRLDQVKDQDGNILKKVEYHYKNL